MDNFYFKNDGDSIKFNDKVKNINIVMKRIDKLDFNNNNNTSNLF